MRGGGGRVEREGDVGGSQDFVQAGPGKNAELWGKNLSLRPKVQAVSDENARLRDEITDLQTQVNAVQTHASFSSQLAALTGNVAATQAELKSTKQVLAQTIKMVKDQETQLRRQKDKQALYDAMRGIAYTVATEIFKETRVKSKEWRRERFLISLPDKF